MRVLKNTDFKAGDLIKKVAQHIQGGGGGQPFYATAGGKNPEGIEKALRRGKKHYTRINFLIPGLHMGAQKKVTASLF